MSRRILDALTPVPAPSRLQRLGAWLDGNPLAIALVWTLAIGIVTAFAIRWPR